MERLPLEVLLGATSPRIVTLVGAGGKTTLMYALARGLEAAGRRVICTTTTHLFPPDNGMPLLLLDGAADPVAAIRRAGRCCVVAASLLPAVRKLEGLTPQALEGLAAALPDAVFLVEADGAARKPLKAPAAYEPVWPRESSCTIAIVGLDSLGCPLDEAHVHRAALACGVTGQVLGSTIAPVTLARLAEHAEGLFRGCPTEGRRIVFANKADAAGQAGLAGLLRAAKEAADLSPSVAWFAGSAAQGWCVPLTGKTLGIVPFRDLP